MRLKAPQGHGCGRERSPVARAELARYGDRLEAILARTRRMNGDALEPPPLRLAPDARCMWPHFHDYVEREQREGGELRPIRAFAAKMAEHAGRLAAVLTLYRDPWQALSDPRSHLARIYQYGPNLLRHAATARRIGAILEEHGWIRRLPASIELDGGSRREAWELVR